MSRSRLYLTGAGRYTYLHYVFGALDYERAARRIIARGNGYDKFEWKEYYENSLKIYGSVFVEFERRGQTYKIRLQVVEE